MKYHCPECQREVNKESFGYPVCCGSTMKQGAAPKRAAGPSLTNKRLREMTEELDKMVPILNMTDWELTFISDMMDQNVYRGSQPIHINRLWEKYCG